MSRQVTGSRMTLSSELEARWAAAYHRVSTHNQAEEGTSLETQGRATHDMALKLGYTIPAEYDWYEQASGADPTRPYFLALQDAVSDRRPKAVFVNSSDRLARDTLAVLQFIRLCKDNDVKLYFADGSSVETAEDEAMQYLRAYFGSREREQTAERTMRGKRAVAESGRMPCGYGRGVFGYDYDPVNKVLVINELEAAVIQLIFRLRLDGLPVYCIATRLNEFGIRTKHGCLWECRQVDSILRNKIYIGERYYGKARYQTINGRRIITPRPKSEWLLVPSPVLLEGPVFDAAQAMWKRPVSPDRHKLWDYLFTGHMECPTCGSTMSGATNQSGGHLYVYYRCCGTVPTPKLPKMCSEPAVPGVELERVVWSHVAAAVRDPSVIIADLRKHWKTGTGRLGQRIARLDREIKKCRSEKMSIVRQHARGLIDQQMQDDLVAPVANLLAKHERDLAVLLEQKKLQDAADFAEQRIRTAFAQYADGLENLGWEGKRALLNRLKVRVVGTKKRVLVTAEIDPELFTIEHTLASPSSSKYSFEIVHLEECVVRTRPRVVEYVPC